MIRNLIHSRLGRSSICLQRISRSNGLLVVSKYSRCLSSEGLGDQSDTNKTSTGATKVSGTCPKCRGPLQSASATNDPPIFHCFKCSEFSFGPISLGSSLSGARKTSGMSVISESMTTIKNPPKPKEIVEHLDKYVINQCHAKKVLAVALYNHYCRLKIGIHHGDQRNAGKSEEDYVKHEKSNVLLAGPSGTGKTLLAKTLAEMLKVPFAICDATTMTEAGYVGEDVDAVLQRLLDSAGGSVGRAQLGIVFLDEIDKISKQQARPDIGKDVGGEGVQQALLKMLEGTIISIPNKKKNSLGSGDTINFDTTNLLFILSGAFSGLEDKVKGRLNSRTMGFGYAKDRCKSALPRLDWTKEVNATDLIAYGMIPEFVGRVPVIAVLSPLDEKALVRALVEPKNALFKQYKSLMAMQDIDLKFTNDALHAIARETMKTGTGARGLRTIMERILLPIMYEAPSSNYAAVTIDEGTVNGQEPLIALKKASPSISATAKGSKK